jgi:hypothetical protein
MAAKIVFIRAEKARATNGNSRFFLKVHTT